MKRVFLTDIYRYRRYIWKNAWNDLRYRYAGTGMGIFWNAVHPLIVILLYTAIFSWIFPQRARGPGYVLYLTSGVLAWRVFADTLQRGSNAFIEHARELKRLAIPAEVFVAKIVLTATFLLFIYYLLLLPVSLFLGNRLDWQLLPLPALLICLQILAFGMSLALANLRALFPDIEQILQALLPLWMWTLPIIYPETVLPEMLRPWLWVNPPYIFLRAIRQVILQHQLPAGYAWGMMLLWLWLVLWAGVTIHRKLHFEVKEVI